ncbi:IS21 family transposase [Proteinivorax hydrogeniformans]|uniref:IS21 family transposase n=1 Tax=Proteinivorax hydrogeniformans TaxID=1826727 RepID=A0AAU8HVC8_9FIRM
MKRWDMFAKIKENRSRGLNKSQVARLLEIDYKTVSKYWDMEFDEFSELHKTAQSRRKKVDKYEKQILEWIKEYRDMSAAQIYDWLLEKHDELDFKERTLRLYVNKLRKEYDLPKVTSVRQYEEIEDLPMGYQAQVDLGEIWLETHDNKRVKVYCFGMVLSHSRYKFVWWSDKPFTTSTFIKAHNKAFEYFGGRPKEIVYDQDKVLVVSENNGDILYTEGFQNYLNSLKFKVYLCRKADPESKGKVEAVVKYAKNNFAKHRKFVDIESFNDDSLKWLERTGNKKVHETTKKAPAEVFALEKEHLMPIPTLFAESTDTKILTYLVRKNNTVFYKQNRYQVPIGTYSPGKEVGLSVKKDCLDIIDKDTNELIITHKIANGKGQLVTLGHPDRQKTRKYSYDEMREKVLKSLGETDKAITFIDIIRAEKSRYFKDQSNLIIKTVTSENPSLVQKAIDYCVERKLYSAGMLKDTIQYFKEEEKRQLNKKYFKADISTPSKYQDLKPEIRSIEEYTNSLKGDNHSGEIGAN